MESILIANTNSKEIEVLESIVGRDFTVHSVSSEEEFDAQTREFDLVVLDQNFTRDTGTWFLMKILNEYHVPVLMLTPPDDAHSAFEALKLGAQNYLVKIENYQELLNLAIKEVMRKFEEEENLKQMIATLKSQVTELEGRLGTLRGQVAIQRGPSSQPGKMRIIDEINVRFRRGEINLPSFPKINIRFRQMMEKGASIQKIGDLLKQDVGISSKLISVSNSAAYGGLTKNTTLPQAVSRLGLKATKMYVDVICNRALYTTKSKKYNDLLKNLWEHSIACAHASEIVSQAVRLKNSDEVFAMGLVHDIGKLILLQIVSELEIKDEGTDEVDRAELLETLDAHHGRFGEVLLRAWKFPDAYSEICQYHDEVETVDPPSTELLVVSFANLLAKSMGYGQERDADIDLESTTPARLLELDMSVISEFRARVEELMSESMRILS
jgi:HD-like signal output (HDOD) protein/CheY-like chemotaxis protein